jgi:hypothetical protein
MRLTQAVLVIADIGVLAFQSGHCRQRAGLGSGPATLTPEAQYRVLERLQIDVGRPRLGVKIGVV